MELVTLLLSVGVCGRVCVRVNVNVVVNVVVTVVVSHLCVTTPDHTYTTGYHPTQSYLVHPILPDSITG